MGLDPVILGFLRMQPMTGYQLKKNIDFSVGNFWTASFGGLYPALNRLEQQGQINMIGEDDRGKTYTISPQGEDAFRSWLTSPVKKPQIKDGFLLRLFFAKDDELSELLPQVSRRLAETTQLYQQLNAQPVQTFTSGQEFCLNLAKERLSVEIELLKRLQARILNQHIERSSQ